MNLSSMQITAVSQWHAQSSRCQEPDLKEVQRILGLENGCIARDDYELDGHFAYPVDPADFDADYIADELTADRYSELSEGATPTEEETALWKQKKENLVFEEDGCWHHFYLWRVDLSEGTIYFRSLHGDGGALDAFDGPFNNEQEALKEAANLELYPPD